MAISITDKHNCTGCSACYSSCPTSAITLTRDGEGFLYPEVNATLCVECGICKRVCPSINPNEKNEAIKLFAAINKDPQIRKQSTSGGTFSTLAEKILDRGGVIFGVAFNSEWRTHHIVVESRAELAQLRGSKYLQSDLGDSFRKVKEYLDQDRWVLFSGTPCQADGVRRTLGGGHEKLIIVDNICHCVPSPAVFSRYIQELTSGRKLQSFSFRSKINGWHDYHISYTIDGQEYNHPAYKDSFTFAFFKHLSIRPSCFKCPSKEGRSRSDITIADFWGVESVMAEIDDNQGCSLVIVNNRCGEELLESCHDSLKIYPLKDRAALKFNHSYAKSVTESLDRKLFMSGFQGGESIATLVKNYKESRPLIEKISKFITKVRFNLKRYL